MSKQCLDVQQMQHLQELGLDTSNASLCYYKQEGWEANYFIALTCDIKEKGGLAYYYDSFGNKEYTLNEVIPAYTLQDILDKLPEEINVERRRYWLCIDMADERMFYFTDDFQMPGASLWNTYFRDGKTLLDAAYEMLVWCIEKGYVKTERGSGQD